MPSESVEESVGFVLPVLLPANHEAHDQVIASGPSDAIRGWTTEPSYGNWEEFSPGTKYEVEIRICSERESGFSVYAPCLPGAASQGGSEQEAVENIREALCGLIESYRADRCDIPWERVFEQPLEAGEQRRWIVVHVG